ncbi:RNA polymerase sigma factor [Microbacterium sp. No. 7]|uniref:RNA polymerase sigma factor n=1 Tax=Microbacterium sp. No. 7 TaxID=1714373 RepID=UPI0018CFF163|nr:sigma-70 family RNA polymerase sigma factor [Microbacterium sp. No. 7]
MSASSESELLSRVRDGDAEAWAELWQRHVGAALRLGRRIAPGRAEDLVSEAFLATYQQLTVRGNGPRDGFRAYILATMRNTAIRWQKADRLTDLEPEIEALDLDDGFTGIEDREDAAMLLAAFQGLPQRWQRVLWLSEVEETSRGEIAADLGIKPNAVSALLRRARTGLQESWLRQHVPESLRDDETHVARLLPELIVRNVRVLPTVAARSHVAACGACADVWLELLASHRQIRGKTLATAGFAALGVALQAASPMTLGASAATLTLAVLAAVAASTAVVVVAGSVIYGTPPAASVVTAPAPPYTVRPVEQQTAPSPAPLLAPTADVPMAGPVPGVGDRRTDVGGEPESPAPIDVYDRWPDLWDRPPADQGSENDVESPRAPSTPTDAVGRGNLDPSIEPIDFSRDEPPTDFYEPPARPSQPDTPLPRPAPEDPVDPGAGTPGGDGGETPVDPGAGTPGGDGGETPDEGADPPPRSGIETPAESSGYLAPTLAGRTEPGVSVAVEYERQPDEFSSATPTGQFLTTADSDGAWSFNLSPELSDYPGTYDYRVWTVVGEETSTADTGRFVLMSPTVTGFESLDPFEMLPLAEASTTGIVFQVTGPPNGSVCLTSVYSGQAQQIGLDDTGTATKRMRFLAGGTYYLVFRGCEGEYRGPATEVFVDVEGEEFSPLGPDPATTVFELVDP